MNTILLTLIFVSVGAKNMKGSCGPSCNFAFHDSNKTMIISGSGEMKNYKEALIPWFSERDKIETLRIYGISKIGKEAFILSVNLKTVEFSSSLLEIDDYAFMNCQNLKSINIPKSVKRIGRFSFANMEKLKTVKLNDGLEILDDFAFARSYQIDKIDLPKTLKSIGMYCFQQCKTLKEITIPEGITEIKRDTFTDCDDLEKIYLPTSLRKIGKLAFANNRKLISITIPEGVVEMENAVFYSSPYLKTVVLPSTLKEVGRNLFTYCESLEQITFKGTVEPKYGEDIFKKSSTKIKIVVPSDYKESQSKKNHFFGLPVTKE